MIDSSNFVIQCCIPCIFDVI